MVFEIDGSTYKYKYNYNRPCKYCNCDLFFYSNLKLTEEQLRPYRNFLQGVPFVCDDCEKKERKIGQNIIGGMMR